MVEAAIVLPVVILISVLIIRLFVFYLEILSCGIKEHEAVVAANKEYKGVGIKHYESSTDVVFVKGGMLGNNLNKSIRTEGFICNEDAIVRAGKLVGSNEK